MVQVGLHSMMRTPILISLWRNQVAWCVWGAAVQVQILVGRPILSEKMGRRTNHFDHEAYYASKSMKELQEYLKTAEEFSEKYPQFKVGWHNEYIHMLKLRIAERIGKKG